MRTRKHQSRREGPQTLTTAGQWPPSSHFASGRLQDCRRRLHSQGCLITEKGYQRQCPSWVNSKQKDSSLVMLSVMCPKIHPCLNECQEERKNKQKPGFRSMQRFFNTKRNQRLSGGCQHNSPKDQLSPLTPQLLPVWQSNCTCNCHRSHLHTQTTSWKGVSRQRRHEG